MYGINAEPYINDYETKAQLSVNNDTMEDVRGVVHWALRDTRGNVLKEDNVEVTVPAMSVATLDEMDFNKTDTDNTYLSFEFLMNGNVISEGTALFTAPKYFNYVDPNLRCDIHGDELTVYADAYAAYVEIDSPDCDFVLGDNYFEA